MGTDYVASQDLLDSVQMDNSMEAWWAETPFCKEEIEQNPCKKRLTKVRKRAQKKTYQIEDNRKEEELMNQAKRVLSALSDTTKPHGVKGRKYGGEAPTTLGSDEDTGNYNNLPGRKNKKKPKIRDQKQGREEEIITTT
ncbi:hypothetical protein NDU88_003586 [Pleurodeles waltl]|uniref:Uncharacterized protein n=1 Tax=Pleurodeles waltl TaxID=8319 RepID=A0AAV7W7E5_PLEWA|nr:hypothetical protein NDU88_003586 [Pleurodeles waltl]